MEKIKHQDVMKLALLVAAVFLGVAPLPAYAVNPPYSTLGDCNCPTDFTPDTECYIDEANEIATCLCDNNETGACQNYYPVDISPDPQQVPEMSDYLAALFILVTGLILFRLRKRQTLQ